ncbi:MAG: archease [Nanoarchaeota archaeon]|nr:archease [Nanoarchaeota archaeon]
MKFKFFDHTADIKFQAYGSSKEEAFKNAALALTEFIIEEDIKAVQEKTIEVEGMDEKQLLYSWLEQFLILLDTEGFLLSTIEELKIDGNKLKAKVKGDSAENYKLTGDAKAITYHDMEITHDDGWMVQVVIDI